MGWSIVVFASVSVWRSEVVQCPAGCRGNVLSLAEIVMINERMWWVTLLRWQEGSCRYTVDAGKPGLVPGDPAIGRAGRKGGQAVV